MASPPKRRRNNGQSKFTGKSAGARGSSPQTGGQVRIISGRWRGRKLAVPDVNGLRPTGDRLRETLFNWLQPRMVGSHCLDLFAGSGALGFEAYSRYAASVSLIESHELAYRSLQKSLVALQGEQKAMPSVDPEPKTNHPAREIADESVLVTDAQSQLVCRPEPGLHLLNTTAEQFLADNKHQFDLVFVDPPFDAQLQDLIISTLLSNHLAPGALIYVESPRSQSHDAAWTEKLHLFREKLLGDVRAQLLELR